MIRKKSAHQAQKEVMSLHFPDADTIKNYLLTHPLLAEGYYKEKEITDAVSELAAIRFANRKIEEVAIPPSVAFIICDLTDQTITKTNQLSERFWTQLSIDLRCILINCGRTTFPKKNIPVIAEAPLPQEERAPPLTKRLTAKRPLPDSLSTVSKKPPPTKKTFLQYLVVFSSEAFTMFLRMVHVLKRIFVKDH